MRYASNWNTEEEKAFEASNLLREMEKVSGKAKNPTLIVAEQYAFFGDATCSKIAMGPTEVVLYSV